MTDDELMLVPPKSWMFPYIETCRKLGVLELDSGDVLDLCWDEKSERPTPGPPGSGNLRSIVIRVTRAWHGYAEKVVVSPMKGDISTASTAHALPSA